MSRPLHADSTFTNQRVDASFTYRYYLTNVEYIAVWLAEASQSRGYVLRERRVNPKAESHTKEKKYVVSMADFIPMAEMITQGVTSIMVPVRLVNSFERAIHTRSIASGWFQTKAGSGEESTAKHRSFGTVLEHAYELLKPHLTTDWPTQRGVDTNNKAPSAPSKDLNAGPSMDVELDLKQNRGEKEHEMKLAVAMFLRDLEGLREVVCGNWRKCKNGEIDIAVAAMITDSAIKLVRKAEMEMKVIMPQPKNRPVSLRKLLEEMETALNQQTTNDASHTPTAPNFWLIRTGLKLYLDRLNKWNPQKSLPFLLPKELGKLSPNTLKAIEFAQVICIISQFGPHPRHPTVWDLASAGVTRMCETRKISAWVVFAVELHIDSLNILDEASCIIASHELSGHILRLSKQHGLLFPEEHPVHPVQSPVSLNDTCDEAKTWVLNNGFHTQFMSLMQIPQVSSHPILKKARKNINYFLGNHPLLCGMLKFSLFRAFHAAAFQYETYSEAIKKLAHVYTTGLLDVSLGPGNAKTWPDMEFVIRAQKPAWLFHGEVPTKLEGLQRILRTVADLPSTRHSRPGKAIPNLKDCSMFGESIRQQITADDLSKLNMVDRLGRSLLYREPVGNISRQLLPSDASMNIYSSPNVVLEGLAQFLQADMVDLYFDWYKMQRVCNDIWKDIVDVLDLPGRHNLVGSYLILREQALSTLGNDSSFPNLLRKAYDTLMNYVDADAKDTYIDTKDTYPTGGDICLITLARYHRQSAMLLRRPEVSFSVYDLYAGWELAKWCPRWHMLLTSPRSEKLRNRAQKRKDRISEWTDSIPSESKQHAQLVEALYWLTSNIPGFEIPGDPKGIAQLKNHSSENLQAFALQMANALEKRIDNL
ncbi:hypothetical protein N0V90_011819 [Kalmusia sp. IMI 367209]|nr:hypothetical protein N0V90_011819 [Kalmusia sp. IMI 367209]